MDKWEKYLLYAIPLIGAAALVFYLMTKQQAAAPAAAPGQAVAQVLPSNLVKRGLTPQDLGVTDFNLTALGAGWTNMVNTAVPQGIKEIKFTGLSYSGTLASQVRISAGTSMREYWPVRYIAGLISHVWYDDSPSVALENQPVVIDVNFTGAATEYIGLMGEVTEIRGRTVA